jgi:hypothetical protein
VTPDELRAARATLGQMWGLDRPLRMAELGRALRLTGRDVGATVRDWERGSTITGPVSVAIEAMLAGFVPEHIRDGALQPVRKGT